MIDMVDNQGVTESRGLHADLMVTNERLRVQQVTLEGILMKLGSLEASWQSFATYKAVLDERLANERQRVDELEKTVGEMSKQYEATKAQAKALWWAVGLIAPPVVALLVSALRSILIGK